MNIGKESAPGLAPNSMTVNQPTVFALRDPLESRCGDVDLGPAQTAWWEVPLPCCFDCKGRLEWGAADQVPGTRRCVSCGAVFNVVSTSDGRVRLRRESLYR